MIRSSKSIIISILVALALLLPGFQQKAEAKRRAQTRAFATAAAFKEYKFATRADFKEPQAVATSSIKNMNRRPRRTATRGGGFFMKNRGRYPISTGTFQPN